MLFKNKFVFYTILFYISYLSFPIAKDILQIPTSILDFIVLGVVLFFSPKAFSNKVTLWAGVYLFVLLLYLLSGKGLPGLGIADYEGERIFVIESAKILTNLAIFSFWLRERDTLPWDFFMRFTLVLFVISFLYIIPATQLDVNLMRQSEAHGANHTFGIPSYSLTHAYMFIVSTILCAILTYKGREKWTFIIVLLLLLATIYKSYISTTLFLSTISIIMAFFYRDNTNRTMASALIILTIFLVLFYSGIMESLLDVIVNVFSGTASENKMIELRAMVLGLEVDDSGAFQTRSELHQISWDLFKQNILFGGKGGGGHSYIIDRLGGLGLVGTIPFLLMLFSSFKIMYQVFQTKKIRYFLIIFGLMVFAMMYTKGLFGEEAWMTMWGICPIYFYAIYKKELASKRNNRHENLCNNSYL